MNTALAMPEDFTPTEKQTYRWERAIANAEKRFLELDPALDYNSERVFAYQLLSNPKNDYAMRVAEQNPQSLLLALVNLAATGLTLNPVHQYACLIPRDGVIKLDIMYRGLIKIATDAGAILWARADIVHEADTFIYHGPAREPEVTADPFAKAADRGAIRGSYCIAKTADGAILTEAMSMADIEAVRNSSDAWVKKKKGPWLDWPEEMMKKSVIKRARKTWPNSVGLERLDKAIKIANDAEGGYTLQSHLRLAGAPTDGVWDAMDAETQTGLQKLALSLGDFHEAGNMAGALDYLLAQRLTVDEEAALWTRLDSKVRSAIKRERDARKPA